MNIKERIEKFIKENKVFVFMKGTPERPECGFSSVVVAILKKHKILFGSFNVLEDEEMRQGIKDYSEWPTIPQVFIDGEFVGGADILREMDERGELAGRAQF